MPSPQLAAAALSRRSEGEARAQWREAYILRQLVELRALGLSDHALAREEALLRGGFAASGLLDRIACRLNWYDAIYGDDPSTDNIFGREELVRRDAPLLHAYLAGGGHLSEFHKEQRRADLAAVLDRALCGFAARNKHGRPEFGQGEPAGAGQGHETEQQF